MPKIKAWTISAQTMAQAHGSIGGDFLSSCGAGRSRRQASLRSLKKGGSGQQPPLQPAVFIPEIGGKNP
jgi:hypothetical protein